MPLDAIPTNAAIALLTSVAFLWLYRLSTLAVNAVSRLLIPARSLRRELLNGPGQRQADTLRDTRTQLLQYKAAGLVFGLVFTLLWLLGGRHINPLPEWQAIAVSCLVIGLLAAGLGKTLWLLQAARRLRFARDARRLAADRLRDVCGDRCTVFHDVPASDVPGDVIDHVLIGVQGLYAVQLIDRPPRGEASATVEDGCIRFGNAKDTVELATLSERVRRLQHQLSKQLGRMITLRSVVALPGWAIQGNADGAQLVVSHRNIAMLRGWRDAREFLMDEDAEALQQWCAAHCRRHPAGGRATGLPAAPVSRAA
jgi:hypothetical protein